MVRVQLYLPTEMYDDLKVKAKQRKMTFAHYIRMELGEGEYAKKKKQTLEEAFPFLKIKFDIDPARVDTSHMNEIDKALYGGDDGPL